MIRRQPRSALFPSTTLFRFREQPRRRRIAVIVDEDQLRRPRLSAEELAERREVRRQTVGAIPHGDNERQVRSEEHTSELQSRPHLVCRLLPEKKYEMQLICR